MHAPRPGPFLPEIKAPDWLTIGILCQQVLPVDLELCSTKSLIPFGVRGSKFGNWVAEPPSWSQHVTCKYHVVLGTANIGQHYPSLLPCLCIRRKLPAVVCVSSLGLTLHVQHSALVPYICTEQMESQPSTVSLWSRVRHQLYRHRFIITIPPVLFYFIYADYSRTQQWKKQKALADQQNTK